MKFEAFRKLQEAKRAETPTPLPDTLERQAIRAPGDVGMVDRLTQIDRDKPKKVTVRTPARRMGQAVDRIMGRRLGEPNVPETAEVDRNYNQRSQFIDRVDAYRDPVDKLLSKAGEEDIEIDPRYDPDAQQDTVENPGPAPRGWSPDSKRPQDKEYTAKLKAYQAAQQSPSAYAGGNPDTAARMAAAAEPGMDALSAADRVMRDKVQDAERGALRNPLEVPGLDPVVDTAYQRHGYQSSGLGLQKNLSTDDLDYIFSAIQDDEPVLKGPSKTKTIDKREDGVEQLKQNRGSPRDIEALSPGAEEEAAKRKAYLTPEVRAKQAELRKALETQDAKEVQRLTMPHEVDDETVQKFIDMYGYNRQNNSNLLTRIKNFGNTAPKTARYGGDLGPAAKDAEVAPGVYNYNKLTTAQKKQAEDNRTFAMVKTYLKQGARDAYAMHEGMRSITDMDLEHITSLRGEGAGMDHPDNWVFASGELNKLKGERNLTGPGSSTEAAGEGPSAVGDEALDNIKRSFDDLTADLDAETIKDMIAAFGGDPRARQRGVFGKTRYNNLKPHQREALRAKASSEFGLSDDEISNIFPDPKPDPNTPYLNAASNEFELEPGSRIGGMPYVYDPDQFERDYITDAKDRAAKRQVVDMLRRKYPGISKDERDNSREYNDFLNVIRRSKGAVTRDEEPVTVSDLDMTM